MKKSQFNKLAIGTAFGLIIGPWVGLALIRFFHVGYLETEFAITQLINGHAISLSLSLITLTSFGDFVTGLSRRIVLSFVVLGAIIDLTEFILILRKIIP
jgi:hypothetical protein